VRIIAGKFKGRWLTSPGARVRPTAEPLRDAWLHLLEPELEDARVLDLFAGSGALGLEALSRGAKTADFVEFGPESLHALKANVAALKVQPRTRIFKRDAIPFTEALEPLAYDVAFADPPYGSRKLDRIVETWLARPFSRILTVEHAVDQAVPAGGSTRVYGDAAITLYRARPAPDAPAEAP
jgi:16S rRNA (guanine966-N2)-methyltransferase